MRSVKGAAGGAQAYEGHAQRLWFYSVGSLSQPWVLQVFHGVTLCRAPVQRARNIAAKNRTLFFAGALPRLLGVVLRSAFVAIQGKCGSYLKKHFRIGHACLLL